VIGTGSSGVQIVSPLAKQAAHVTVFQRSPAYVVPSHNRPLEKDELVEYKKEYSKHREGVRDHFLAMNFPMGVKPWAEVGGRDKAEEYLEEAWKRGGLGFQFTFLEALYAPPLNDIVAEFVHAKIRGIVKDPEVAKLLTSHDYPIGSKRLVLDSEYYHIFNRDNVHLVSIKDTPIEEITPTGVKVANKEHEVDVIVLATGYDILTGALKAVDVLGVGGKALNTHWEAGPVTYLGLMSAGFPNLFIITGPGSPSVFSNMVYANELHVEWIAALLAHLKENHKENVVPTPEAEKAWTEHVQEVGKGMLLLQNKSWYMGSNIPGKPRSILPYTGGIPRYNGKLKEVVAKGYEGFTIY